MQRQALSVPNSNPFYVNPTGGTDPVLVHYGFGDDLGIPTSDVAVTSWSGSFGGTVWLGKEWELKTYLSTARAAERFIEGKVINQTALAEALADDDPATAFNPFGDGSFTNPITLARLGEDIVSSWRTDIGTLGLAAEGPLGSLYDREIKIAAGVDFQRQAYQSRRGQGTAVWWDRALDREIFAAYAEMRLPIFSADHRWPGFERLDLSLAARYENYGRFGADSTPRAGLLWSPIKNFSIRATWSQAFGAPLLLELDESANALALFPQIDPASPSGFSNVLVLFGDGNRNLHNETSTSRTLGWDLKLPAYGISFDMTYFDIERLDGTVRPDGSLAMLQDPRMTGLVTWNPSHELRESLCAENTFAGAAGVLGDPADCVNADVVALIDLRTQNIAAVRTSGVDFHAAYSTAGSRIGSVGLDLSGTYLFKFARAPFGGGAYVDVVNTQHNPMDLRLRGSLSWKYRGFGSSYSLHYFDHYKDIRSIPNRKVSSWTTMDLQLSYDLGYIGHEPFEGAVVSLNAQNVLDKEPPFLNNPLGVGYDEENADLLGRFVSLQLRKTW
jgi:iron complex outermembrane recepter protein